MRSLIALALCGLLAACALPQTQPDPILAGAVAVTPTRGPAMVGTLADAGTYEMVVAPAYTRLALQRRAAARAIQDGRMTATLGRQVQTLADTARANLDAAWAIKRPTQEAEGHMAEAARVMKRIDQLLGAEK